MPKHEPEVLAAIRRRNDRVVLDDNFPEAAAERQVLRCPRCKHPYMRRRLHYETDGSLPIEFSCNPCGDDVLFDLVITNCRMGVFIEWREP